MTADPDKRPHRERLHTDGIGPGGARLAVSVLKLYGRTLQRYLIRRVHKAQEIQDLEQEVYLRLLRVRDAELVHNPEAYMCRIASHVVHEYRQRARQEFVAFDSDAVDEKESLSPEISADRLAEELHAQRQFDRVLKRLPAKWRAMFVLHMRDGLTHAEVAKKLNISAHTVKKQMFRAFLALRSEPLE